MLSGTFTTQEEVLLIYSTADDGRMLVPPETVEHLDAHPEVWEVLEEAVAKVELTGRRNVEDEIDLGRIIGRTGCVTTPLVGYGQTSFFVQRPARRGPSRVVKTDTAPEISTVSIVATPTDMVNTYVLHTAYIGTLAPPEPWNRCLTTGLARRRSLEFWSTHALVYQPFMGRISENNWQKILQGM